MDSSIMEFINNVMPQEAIRHDQDPKNQQVIIQVIELNTQTLPEPSLLPLICKLVYFEERNGVSAFSALNKDVYVFDPTALPPPKRRLV